MKKIILLHTAMICCLFVFAQSKILNIEETGTLSTLISESEKYEISELTLTGRINGDDVNFIRQMAGGSQFDGYTNGKLAKLDIGNAMLVQGGSYKSGGHTFSYTSNLEISESMFAYLEKITLITLPATTKAIGINAFYNCINLENITIPDNTFSIERGAFRECKSLEYIVVGKNLEETNGRAFSSCESLKYFIVHQDNNHFQSIDGVLYSHNGDVIIAYPNAKSSEYVIPENVKKIGVGAFSGCSLLESVRIPNNLLEIGDYAFESCTNLKTVNIPLNISSLSGTFWGCTSLMTITIPSNIQRIFDSLNWCENLEEIYSKNIVPPYPAYFEGVNTIDCVLYVPKGSYDAYYKAEGWRNFLNIIEKDYVSAIYNPNNNLSIYGSENLIMVKSDISTIVDIYSILGVKYTFTINIGLNELTLPKGIYIAEGQKVIVY